MPITSAKKSIISVVLSMKNFFCNNSVIPAYKIDSNKANNKIKY